MSSGTNRSTHSHSCSRIGTVIRDSVIRAVLMIELGTVIRDSVIRAVLVIELGTVIRDSVSD